MKKVVANVVVVVLASLFLTAKHLILALHLINKELEPYIKPVSFLQIAAFISVSVVGMDIHRTLAIHFWSVLTHTRTP